MSKNFENHVGFQSQSAPDVVPHVADLPQQPVEQSRGFTSRYKLACFAAAGLAAGLWGSLAIQKISENVHAHPDNYEPSGELELGELPMTSLDDARGGGITEERWQELHDATIRMHTTSVLPNGEQGGGSCTATFVNEAVLTAAHCLGTEEGEETTDVRFYAGEPSEETLVMQGVSWALHPSKDIAAVKVEFTRDDVDTLFVPAFDASQAERGTQYYVAGLPGDTTSPVPAELTYIYRDAEEGTDLLVREMSDPAAACNPGSSGSLVTDGGERYGIMSGYMNHDGEGWDATIDHYSNLSQISLKESAGGLCWIDNITSDDVDLLYGALDD